MREAGRLNRFAVEPRYLGLGRPVAEAEYREVLEVALRVAPTTAAIVTGPMWSPTARANRACTKSAIRQNSRGTR